MTNPNEPRLTYRPCECPGYVVRADEAPGAGYEESEHFDYPGWAAARFIQVVKEKLAIKVHHRGLHVCAVEVDGERFEEG